MKKMKMRYSKKFTKKKSIGEQQRMAEGRRMFQIFAAKMFEQRVLTAYREKVAQERQRRLLEELEEEEKAKEGAKLEKEKKKAAKKYFFTKN